MQFRGSVLVRQFVNKIGDGLASAHHLADHAGGDIERIVIPIKIIGNKICPDISPAIGAFISAMRFSYGYDRFPDLWISTGVFNQIERHIG